MGEDREEEAHAGQLPRYTGRTGLRARRFRSTLHGVRIPLALVLGSALAQGLACAPSGGGSAGAPQPAQAASGAALAPWSRGASPQASAESHAAEPAVLASADPAALDDLIAAAPKADRAPTGKDGGTAIGTDTGRPEGSAAAPIAAGPPEARHAPKVVVGAPVLEPVMANAAIERAARAQLYWNLVQRCRDPEGKILPPDAVRLRFKIDGDGFIVPSSINATADDPKFVEAARCMQRELSTTSFQAPAASRGREGAINATLPSID